MKQKLTDCIEKIRNDSDSISTFNEAQARQSIIEPILEAVNWNTRDYNEVKIEYGVETRRVDYALQINGDNELFIEAKKPSEPLKKHQEQLLEYSFKEGVALAILTNGITWWFYLPLQRRAWDERKFYTIDILEQEPEDIVDKFDQLLSRENIASNKAVEYAESILEHRQREKILRERLPEAWNRVIDPPDSVLVDLLKEMAEEVCGFQLDSDEILRFMRSNHEKWLLSASQPEDPPPVEDPDTKRMQIGSESYELRYIYEILVNTANWLIDKGKLKDVENAPKVKPNGRLSLVCDKIQNSYEMDWKPLKNGFYIYKNLSIEDSIAQAQKLLAHYGYDPKILQVDFQVEEQPKRTPVKYEMTLDGVDYELRYRKEILVNTANWLIDQGDLKTSDCPIKISDRAKRNLIDRSSIHPTGVEFTTARKLKNGLFIETGGAGPKQAIEIAERLLKLYGYDPEILQLNFHHEKAKLEQPKQTRRAPVKYEMTLDDVDYDLRYGYEILVNTANWLIDKGSLKSSDCPIKVSDRAKRSLIDRSSTHPTGVEFTAARKLKNGLFVDAHGRTKRVIEKAKGLLKKYGYDPELLKIEY